MTFGLLEPTTEEPAATAVDVAAGVLVHADGQVLLAQRPERKVYAGYWEFPGGKVEDGETFRVALDRELSEELGIVVQQAYPWLTQTFTYPHATVRIHFFRVVAWTGQPTAKEHQGLEWQRPAHMSLAPMLPANTPILRALELAHEYVISDAATAGEDAYLAALAAQLAAGVKIVVVREPTLARERLRTLAARVVTLCRAHHARVLVDKDIQVAQEVGADGVHLTAQQLAALDQRPPFAWVGASCQDELALAKAEELVLDYVELGPVRASGAADLAALDWQRLARLLGDFSLPVFACGELRRADLEQAWLHGAHGLALTGQAWAAASPKFPPR
jgi:8-oxo-dGTP diphosphatase